MSILREGDSEGEVPVVRGSDSTEVGLGFYGRPGVPCEGARVLSWRRWKAI